MAQERGRPGRKIILWVSPGWPLLSGEMRDARQGEAFANIVEISKQLREGHITLYSVDPSALEDTDPGFTSDLHVRSSAREPYAEEASKPGDVGWEDLALGGIAKRSGGLALYAGNDLASELRKCLADAAPYYEISFTPSRADGRNEYHHLDISVAKQGLKARTTQGYYSQPARPGDFTVASEKQDGAEDDALAHKPGTSSSAPADTSDPSSYVEAHPYLDLPLAQLLERIPALKNLQPAPDQQGLSVILETMGLRLDAFVRDIGDLIAHEDVTQERLNATGKIEAKERVQDEYLILHHGYEWGASAEYRMDEKGNRLGSIGLERGYLVTSGFALSCISFSTVAQPQSRFRYLGEEKIGTRETYVLGFAQQPGEARFTTAMKGTGGTEVDMLTPGILWVDKDSFQIIRMRTDLLAPNKEIRLDRETTEVTFGEVQLPDLPNPLWLPSDVDVYMEIAEQKFHNLHHYTNYRRYRVSVEIGAPQ